MNSRQGCWLYALAMILAGLSGCEKVVDVAGPAYRRQAVLTGLIQADSLLRVRLTYNQPATDTTGSQAVGDAQVTFFENDHSLGVAQPLGQGQYQLGYYPKPGASYRVVADIPGYGLLEAQDQLPSLSEALLTAGLPNPGNPNRNPDFTLTWHAHADSAFYWLSTAIQEIHSEYGPGCPPGVNGPLPPGCTIVERMVTGRNLPVSNSLYADRFNASHELEYGYVFSYLLRFDPAQLSNTQIVFPFTVYNSVPRPDRRKQGEGLVVDLMATGPHYDQYLKSVVRALQSRVTDAESALDNPFVEVVPLYSNVKNGLGIFGAMNRQRIRY